MKTLYFPGYRLVGKAFPLNLRRQDSNEVFSFQKAFARNAFIIGQLPGKNAVESLQIPDRKDQ